VNVLDRILERARTAVAGRRSVTPLAEVERRGAERAGSDPLRPFTDALGGPGIAVIAEHKRSSPSAGVIRDELALEDVVAAYELGGAAALSILTEEANFGGSLADLARARTVTQLPLLRKDFIVDPYQVHEALAAGADAILLIVAALADADLESLYAQDEELGLGVLVEVHDQPELERAAALGARVIGINNRDLKTLEVDTERTHALLPHAPSGAILVAESGIRTRTDLDRLAAAGIDAVLVGEALMRAPDIEAACRELTGVAAPDRQEAE
jgi:indole-3-glycerol phosphate synthase